MSRRPSGKDMADAVSHDLGSAFHLAKALTYLLFDPLDAGDGFDVHERRAAAEVSIRLEQSLGELYDLFSTLEQDYRIIPKAEGEA